jgi:hypothetical protein
MVGKTAISCKMNIMAAAVVGYEQASAVLSHAISNQPVSVLRNLRCAGGLP